MWRTGAMAEDPLVSKGLGLAGNERIIGFIYLGSVEGERRSPRVLAPGDFVQAWSQPALN